MQLACTFIFSISQISRFRTEKLLVETLACGYHVAQGRFLLNLSQILRLKRVVFLHYSNYFREVKKILLFLLIFKNLLLFFFSYSVNFGHIFPLKSHFFWKPSIFFFRYHTGVFFNGRCLRFDSSQLFKMGS